MDEADPNRIHTPGDLKQEFDLLRRAAGRPLGKHQLSLQDLVTRVEKERGSEVPRSTLHSYLSGSTLAPAEIYEAILRALGVGVARMGPWAEAWERLDDARREPAGDGRGGPEPEPEPEPEATAAAPARRKYVAAGALAAAFLLAAVVIIVIVTWSRTLPAGTAAPEDQPRADECTYKLVGTPVRVRPAPRLTTEQYSTINVISQPVLGACQPTQGEPGTDTCGIGAATVTTYIEVRFPYQGWVFQPCLHLVSGPSK
ncbi:XRE family transcriptional regulator [Amycolatopsis sp. NPDC089917]|uniref:XRE family transcriptional regulator n=1 Tax=Amycolatopsis sp. NPDC089917 TaxID=3155187 RepID=UPI00344113D5